MVRHTTGKFIGLLIVSIMLFVEGSAIESMVARFMDFWMSKTVPRPRTAVRIVRGTFYVFGCVFLLIAVLLQVESCLSGTSRK